MAKELHASMDQDGYKCTSLRVGSRALGYGCLRPCVHTPSTSLLRMQVGMEGADLDRVVQEFRDGITKIMIATSADGEMLDISQVESYPCGKFNGLHTITSFL